LVPASTDTGAAGFFFTGDCDSDDEAAEGGAAEAGDCTGEDASRSAGMVGTDEPRPRPIPTPTGAGAGAGDIGWPYAGGADTV
jgi:hypothetical protein